MTLNDSGVSETVGFILIIGILITGITLVSLSGYPALLQEQQNANFRNMERGMISLQSEIKSLVYKNVPYRETTLQVEGGTLVVLNEPDPSGASFTISGVGVFYPGESIYTTDDQKGAVSLENGAVQQRFVYDPTGSTMLADPRWVYDAETSTYIIPLIRINASESASKAGFTTVQMKLTGYNQVPYTISPGTTVTYHANPEDNHNTAWRNYLKDPSLHMQFEEGSSDSFNSVFTLVGPADRLVINYYDVEILGL